MSVSVLNTTSSLSGKTLAKLEDTQTFTGQKTFDLGASSPFLVVPGAAKVDNLDSDKLDGQTGADYHDATLLTGLAPTTSVAVEQTINSTGAQNNVAPSDGALVVIRCTGAAPVFSGFTGGAAGRRILLQCLGTTLKVTDQATSTAANQIICESTNGQIVGLGGSILLTYDATTARWRASLLSTGAPISFTPTIGGSGGQVGQAYAAQVGWYVQRGKVITVNFYVQLSTLGTVTTSAQVQGLPFTSANVANQNTPALIGYWTNFTSTLVSVGGLLSPNTSAVTLFGIAAAATGLTALVQADLANTSLLAGSATYQSA